MNNHQRNPVILALSLPMAGLIILASCIGLLVPDFYLRETSNWIAQASGQDAVDLFLGVPALLITSFLAAGRNRAATLLWGGVILYLLYTYVIYGFDVHFNDLFVVYCLTLGLAFYSFMYFLFSQMREPVEEWFSDKLPVNTAAWYLLVIPCAFYVLWLSEIVPATIAHAVPKSSLDAGLPTNPVQVIDLSVFLPGLFVVGLFSLKRKRLGLLLTPVMLMFMILMDITIGVLILVMKAKGLEGDYAVAVAMSVLALFGIVLLILILRSLKRQSPPAS